jgi:hypothetical protein
MSSGGDFYLIGRPSHKDIFWGVWSKLRLSRWLEPVGFLTLVTGPNDRMTIESNGLIMKPSGALVSELTEKVEPPVGPIDGRGAPTPCGYGDFPQANID